METKDRASKESSELMEPTELMQPTELMEPMELMEPLGPTCYHSLQSFRSAVLPDPTCFHCIRCCHLVVLADPTCCLSRRRLEHSVHRSHFSIQEMDVASEALQKMGFASEAVR